VRRRICGDFWRYKNEAIESDPRQLRRIVDTLFDRGRVPASSAISGEAFNQFFAEKVAK